MPAPIHHVALPEDWDAARASGAYTTSTRGRTLDEEGFVHCAFDHQVDGIIARFYADVPAVVIVTIDPARLDAPVVVEAADDVDDAFPHLYGPIPVAAVVGTELRSRATSG